MTVVLSQRCLLFGLEKKNAKFHASYSTQKNIKEYDTTHKYSQNY